MKPSRIAVLAALIAAGSVTAANPLPAGAARPAAAGHAAAVPPVGPKTVVMTTCALPRTSTDPRVPASVVTALGPAGAVYGFASCRTSTPGAIYFFSSRAGHSAHQLAPYRGTLETMAADGTGAVYLCYSVRAAHDTWLYLARRSAQGGYSPPTPITHTVGTFRPQVTLAAAPGTWWLIWSEATGTEQFVPHVLFERRTMLGIRPRHQITFPNRYSTDYSDWVPALAAAGPLARLAWIRAGLDGLAGPGPQITRLLPDGTWQTGFRLPGGGTAAYPAWMTISQGRTYLVFTDAVYLDDGAGHFTHQPVASSGRRSAAVSAGVATIAMLETNLGPPYLQLDELRSGTWSSAQRPTVDSFDGVVSQNGHATLVMHKQSTPMLYLVTEQ